MPIINFSGIASGIDSEALIEALTDATRQQRVEPNETQIQELQDTNSALEEYKTLLSELKAMTGGYARIAGGFIERTATSSANGFVTATASTNAEEGTYTITVNTLAKNHTFSFNNEFTSSSDQISGGTADGTIDVTIGNGAPPTFTINVGTGMTWAELADDFNNQTDQATASVVQVAQNPAAFQLVFTSKNTGIADGQLAFTVNNGGTGTLRNFIDETIVGGVPGSTEDAAVNGQIAVTGIEGTIQTESNTINNLIPGVTLQLLQASITPVTITVGTDTDTTREKVTEMVNKYNEIVEFINENNLVERQEEGNTITNIFGPLSGTRIDDNSLQSLRNSLTASSYTGGSLVRIFADMGIKTERDGTLEFKFDDFTDAMNNESESVGEIVQNFADAIGTTGGVLDQFVRFKGLIDVTVDGNDDQIQNLNDRVARAEASIEQQEANLRRRFARLERTIGELQNQQAALSSALAGLGTG